MSNKHTKTINGFTLIEMLIVITIIVVLASITLVSYVGIQNQAKGETTKTNAASVKKAAETYYSTSNAYPTQVAHFSSTFVNMPSDITLLTSGSLTATNGERSIMYRYISSGAGACIMRWDFMPDTGSPGMVTTDLLGTATNVNCNATTGTLPT